MEFPPDPLVEEWLSQGDKINRRIFILNKAPRLGCLSLAALAALNACGGEAPRMLDMNYDAARRCESLLGINASMTIPQISEEIFARTFNVDWVPRDGKICNLNRPDGSTVEISLDPGGEPVFNDQKTYGIQVREFPDPGHFIKYGVFPEKYNDAIINSGGLELGLEAGEQVVIVYGTAQTVGAIKKQSDQVQTFLEGTRNLFGPAPGVWHFDYRPNTQIYPYFNVGLHQMVDIQRNVPLIAQGRSLSVWTGEGAKSKPYIQHTIVKVEQTISEGVLLGVEDGLWTGAVTFNEIGNALGAIIPAAGPDLYVAKLQPQEPASSVMMMTFFDPAMRKTIYGVKGQDLFAVLGREGLILYNNSKKTRQAQAFNYGRAGALVV